LKKTFKQRALQEFLIFLPLLEIATGIMGFLIVGLLVIIVTPVAIFAFVVPIFCLWHLTKIHDAEYVVPCIDCGRVYMKHEGAIDYFNLKQWGFVCPKCCGNLVDKEAEEQKRTAIKLLIAPW